ncbi:MAG: HdeD family acid-resistance protein [Desulfovibrionaceae bacterium]|nr:HdeD family acid-resistance protein [Desulfovibrionaceae bacterium]
MNTGTNTSFMAESMSGQWGWLAFRGVLAIIFALAAVFSPIATAWALAVLWGAFAFVEGVSAIIGGWRLRKQGGTWWPYLLFGVVGIVAGLLAAAWPGLTMVVLVYIIGIWAVISGMSEIFMSVNLRRTIDRWWLLLLSGIVGVLFGVFLLYAPLEGMLMMIWCLAGFALALGIFSLIFAFRLRKGNGAIKASTA